MIKFFGSSCEEIAWINPQIVSCLNKDSFIDNTQIIKGNSNCNLILQPNSNVEIQGVFHGKIIGLGNNIVRVNGQFDGIISCSKLVILESAKLKGKFWTGGLAIKDEEKIAVEDSIEMGELVPFHHAVEKINFDYIQNMIIK